MIKEVKTDKTLLVNGPASVRLTSGKAEILGASLNVGEKIVVRAGKQVPFYVEENASFDINQAKDSMVEEVDGDTIPISWKKVVEETLALERPTVVMIMGDVDSGKTSLCTLLANRALELNLGVAIVDADLGQSDIGPPTTVGLAYINKSVKDLFHVKADNICFVGFTSPGGAEERVAHCIVSFKNQVLRRKKDFLVINTDGWVEGEGAVQYKVMLAESILPNVVVGLEQENELTTILSKLGKTPFLTVNPSAAVRKRDREKRKALRELNYKRYLRNAKVETFPLNWIRIEGIHFSPRLFLTNARLLKIEKTLGIQPLYCEDTVNTIWVVLKPNQRLDLERLSKVEEVFKKKIKVMRKGNEKGMVVGLHDDVNNFLGLGVMYGFDYKRKIVKVLTSVTQEVTSIRVGNVKLDDAYREIDMMTLCS